MVVVGGKDVQWQKEGLDAQMPTKSGDKTKIRDHPWPGHGHAFFFKHFSGSFWYPLSYPGQRVLYRTITSTANLLCLNQILDKENYKFLPSTLYPMTRVGRPSKKAAMFSTVSPQNACGHIQIQQTAQ